MRQPLLQPYSSVTNHTAAVCRPRFAVKPMRETGRNFPLFQHFEETRFCFPFFILRSFLVVFTKAPEPVLSHSSNIFPVFSIASNIMRMFDFLFHSFCGKPDKMQNASVHFRDNLVQCNRYIAY